MDALVTWLDALTLRGALWLFPIVFAAHVREEWPGFPAWAQQHASLAFTSRDYWVLHGAGLIAAVLVPILWASFPRSWVAFGLFSFVLIPSMGWNTVFHAAATVMSRRYCPGLVTAVMLYLPLLTILSLLAVNEAVLSPAMLVAAAIVAGVFHAAEVGHNVYNAW